MKLIRANLNDAERIWQMQVQAFSKLYEKYKDTETSPAMEPIEKTQMRLEQPFTYYYFIEVEGIIVGAIRVVDKNDGSVAKRISPIFIMDEYRGRGYAQATILKVEEVHGSSNWELDTILQEKSICSLYEKIGYIQTGEIKQINEKLTLVYYSK